MLTALNNVSTFAARVTESVASSTNSFSDSVGGITGLLGPFITAVNTAEKAKKGYEMATNLAKLAKQKFNTAMSASKIGLMITSVGMLVSGITRLVGWMRRQNDVMDEQTPRIDTQIESNNALRKSIEESAEAFRLRQQGIIDESEITRLLIDRMTRLANATDLTSAHKKELSSLIAMLNENMEGLNIQYDMEIDQLREVLPELERIRAARKAEDNSIASQERLAEVSRERLGIELSRIATLENLSNYTQKLLDLDVRVGEEYETIMERIIEYSDELADLKERYNDQIYAVRDAAYAVIESTEKAAEAISALGDISEYGYGKSAEAAERMAENVRMALESLSTEFTTLKAAATDMFNVLSDESALSVGEMTANMEENQRIISEWADNIERLVERGVDQGLLDKLREAGPQSAGHVAAIVEACYREIDALNAAFQNGGEVALQALSTSLGIDISVAQAAADLARDAANTLEDQLEAADFPRIGARLGDSFAKGIDSSADNVLVTVGRVCQDVIDVFPRLLQMQSPSRVFVEYGTQTADGFAIGLQSMNRVIPMMENWATQIIGIAARIPDEMQIIGGNIVDGVWHGIQNAQGMFTANVNRFFSSIVTTAQRSLGINSPSRVFAEIGKNLCQGFINGINSMERNVSDTMEKVFYGHRQNIGRNLAISPVHYPDSYNKYERISGISMNNNFYITNDLDIDHVARELARRTEREIRGRGLSFA
ncbi:MAG: hypothetical protein FWE11_09270 [Defluviitaleaceae bacterium]|nr:hypothetical protein [Defluviitaleaceae bacterium]